MQAERVIKNLLFTPIVVGREILRRLPYPGFHPAYGDGQTRDRARRALDTLRRDGVVFLPAHLQPQTLSRLQEAFSRAVADRPSPHNPDCLENSDFFPLDPVFLEVATDDLVLNVIAAYYGRPFALGRADAQRLLPTPPVEYTGYNWHHDTQGKQIKQMVLVQDLAPDGQRMQYAKGSHRKYYNYHHRYVNKSYAREQIPSLVNKDSIVDVAGPAGTVVLFDTNGLHSGNRNLNGAREVITYYHTIVTNRRPLRFKRDDVLALPKSKRFVVTGNPFHEMI